MSQLSQSALIETVHPGFGQTVPRFLVHKRSLENVLLSEVRACGDHRFTCAGRVPTAHRFFNHAGRKPRKDILFYTELGRQASLAISHAFLDVSTEDVFIFERSEAAVTDAAWASACQSPLDPVVVDIRIQDTTRRRNNAVSRVVAEHVMSIGDEEVFRGTGAWSVQPAALFQRLRKMSTIRSSPAPTEAAPYDTEARVDRHQRESADYVVITRPRYVADTRAFVASLIVDHTDPYFFDHPCDHVPGMLLLEGCAQLALSAFAEAHSLPPGSSGVAAYDVDFAQFVECGIPVTLTAHVKADRVVRISISQQNVVSGTTTMSIAFPI